MAEIYQDLLIPGEGERIGNWKKIKAWTL